MHMYLLMFLVILVFAMKKLCFNRASYHETQGSIVFKLANKKNTYMQFTRFFLIGLLALPALSCDNEVTFEEQLEIDRQIIADYVAENGLEGESTDSGLFYGITEEGNDTYPTANNTVEVIYTGKLLDGTVFDSSQGFPVSFGLWQVIPGWQEGMQLFSEGAKGYLLIPSNIAYGRAGRQNIPPNSVLYFDIELLDVR